MEKFIGDENLVKYENEQEHLKQKQAQDDFNNYIVQGRHYFEYEDTKYYLKLLTTSDDMLTLNFRNNRVFHWIKQGALTIAQVRSAVLSYRESFPPIFCKSLTLIKNGKPVGHQLRLVTPEEKKILEDEYFKGIIDVKSLSKKIKLDKNEELVMQPSETEQAMTIGSAESLADIDALVYKTTLMLYYADDTETHKKDEKVFKTFEEYSENADALFIDVIESEKDKFMNFYQKKTLSR